MYLQEVKNFRRGNKYGKIWEVAKMANNNNNQVLNANAVPTLETMKQEIARELGIDLSKGGDLTAREAGSVGGAMVKRMIQYAEDNMARK